MYKETNRVVLCTCAPDNAPTADKDLIFGNIILLIPKVGYFQ